MKLSAALLGAASSLALCAVSGTAFAQHAVTGLIIDDRGNPLPGARVRVADQGLTATTNRQGEFEFSALPAGDINIEVSYLGLPTATRTMSVSDTGRNAFTFTLSASETMDRIVITGQILDGAARALNQQRTNSATTNIVSADAIGRFPDANIAEALQRVPGFAIQRDQGEGRSIQLRGAPAEFTSIQINGVSLASPDEGSRAIDMDTISSDVVAAIEVSKTLLPNQEADSIAGVVNLITRSPFDRRGPRLNATAGGSYNEIGGTNDWRGSFVASNTFGEDDRIGALFSASYSRTNRQIDNIENDWDFVNVGGQDVAVSDDFTLKDYDTRRTRISFTGALEFRPDDATRFALRGSWSQFEDFEFRNRLTYDLGGLQPGATDTSATWNSARLLRQLRNRSYENTIWTIAGTGEHDFGASRLDYTLGFTRTEGDRPRGFELVYRTGANRTVSQDFTNFDEPVISPFQTGEQLDLTGIGFRQVVDRTNLNIQEEWSGRINWIMDGQLFGHAAEHRIGASARLRDTSHDEERWRDRSGALAPADFNGLFGTERSQNFGYLLGNKFDEGRIQDYYFSIRDQLRTDAFRLDDSSVESDYELEEKIYAAYGMTRVQRGATEVIAGLRVEHTDFSSTAFRYDELTNTATPNSNSRDYTNWFPNLTVRHEFNDNLVGRFALTRSIARPNYPDVVARIFLNDDGDEVERGNPDLNPTLSNNLDAGLEYYFEPLGLVAVNVFYKDLTDYEFTLRTPGVFEGAPVDFIQAENAPDGFIRGIEFTWQQTFTFLPGLLGNTGVFANATFTDSEMDIGRTIAGRSKFPLSGQSDYVYNVALFYEDSRFNARLSWNDRGDYIDSVNASDPRLDTYWEERSQLDFSASVTLTDRFELFVEGKNLTDSEGIRYDGVRRRVQERERFGQSWFLGARFNY
ncbi:TonB-dependent receptor [Alkalicaulis satelles]|uniref:TonB-dependent receptor n=1 Tax=Alkalicaulis satelles TaxID=2609175 RepID=A0A5M6ZGX3_9PROT|nr:TonB-dependent receptor [Alkalicaulis satelles]KAA5803560.1 TonB-dependent receptor [Alkalicaulis satelles]